MTKNLLIASAVSAALLAPSAALAAGHAKSGITVYGKAGIELVSTSASNGSGRNDGLTLDDGSEEGKIGSGNASALGVKGAHDIGNGLTATYNINFNFSVDDNKGLAGGRNASIGLKGSFGAVEFGRVASPYKSSTVKWDPLLTTFMQSRASSAASSLHNGYDEDVIAYKNKFGNATFRLSLDIDETAGNGTTGTTGTPAVAVNGTKVGELVGDHGISASLNIPLSSSVELAIAMHDSGADNSTATKIAAKWKSGNKSAVIQFESLDDAIGDADHVYANFSLGLANNATFVVALGSKSGNNAVQDGSYTAIAYKKKLSKKVSIHMGYVNHDEGSLGNGEDASQIGAGMKVVF